MAWQTLKVGGGGYVTGISVANDGAMVVRTDTNGAYLWTGSQWQHIVTASSMPAGFDFTGEGVYEIQVAASNSNVMYMTFGGYVFKSTNKGTTWTQTAFSGFNDSNDPANDSYRMNGQKMAIDPNNPNIVYAGTPSNGLYVSKDGGTTWTRVSAIPAAAGQGITGILFDPAVGGVVNGVTQTVFAWSYGHGVYESTNGGATWTARSGGPTDVVGAAVSSTGVYYASDGSNLWAYAGGKWTKLTSDSAGIQAVAVNPSNPNEIVAVSGAGYLDISYNAGATWTGPMWSSNQVTSADIPWLAAANKASAGNVYMTVGGAAFNPANPSQMVISAGTGVWTTTQVPTSGATSSTPVTWTDQSVGIENLVANEIIVPPGGDPVLHPWDRPFFKITNPNSYPTTYGPVASDNIVAGWSVDYASSSPSFLVGIADWWGTEESGYSSNGGQTWTKFPTEIPGAGSSFMGERSPPAQPKTSSGRPQADRSLITRSTGVRPGPRSRFPASRVGAVSTGSIISISGRSPPTGCGPTPFIFTIPAKECSRPPTGARVGRTCIPVTSKAMVRCPVSTRRSCPSRAKPAIFSTPGDRSALSVPRRPMNPSIVRPTGGRPGRRFPTFSMCSHSVSARRRRGKAIRQSTSSGTSTASTASGNPPTTPSHGAISEPTRTESLTQ